MATVISPNMNLPVPVVGVEPGPQYATDINNSLTIIDGHSHVSGSGVPITPDALNINSNLTIQNHSLYNIGALTLFPQVSLPANSSLYESGVDLFFIDGNGNSIRITQSGSLAGAAGTITGLPSGTASASFAAGTFIFQASTATGANIDGASFIFRNNTASSFGLTLSPPNAMGANYALVLPSLPAQTNVMTLDTSGNMGSITYDAVGQNMTSVGANAIAASVTRVVSSSPASVGNISKSVSSGAFGTSTLGSFVDVTGLAVELTTSGRPVFVGLIADANSTNPAIISQVSSGNTAQLDFAFSRNASGVSFSRMIGAHVVAGGGPSQLAIPPSSLYFIDSVAAGTYTYVFSIRQGTGTCSVINCFLIAYEL